MKMFRFLPTRNYLFNTTSKDLLVKTKLLTPNQYANHVAKLPRIKAINTDKANDEIAVVSVECCISNGIF